MGTDAQPLMAAGMMARRFFCLHKPQLMRHKPMPASLDVTRIRVCYVEPKATNVAAPEFRRVATQQRFWSLRAQTPSGRALTSRPSSNHLE